MTIVCSTRILGIKFKPIPRPQRILDTEQNVPIHPKVMPETPGPRRSRGRPEALTIDATPETSSSASCLS
jgi:hypothetical protein